MPTVGLWHTGEGGEGESSGTRRLFREDATKLDGTSGSRSRATREILVDERRGAGDVRSDVPGFISRLLLENTRGRGERRMENSGEKKRGRGRRREGKKLRAGRSLSRERHREARAWGQFSHAPFATGFSSRPFSLALTRHFPFCREESFVSHRPPVKDSTK